MDKIDRSRSWTRNFLSIFHRQGGKHTWAGLLCFFPLTIRNISAAPTFTLPYARCIIAAVSQFNGTARTRRRKPPASFPRRKCNKRPSVGLSFCTLVINVHFRGSLCPSSARRARRGTWPPPRTFPCPARCWTPRGTARP